MAEIPTSNADFDKIKEIDHISVDHITRKRTILQHRVAIDDPLVTGYNYIFMTCPKLSLSISQYQEALSTIKHPNAQPMAIQYYNNTARWLGLPLSGSGLKEDNADPEIDGRKNIIIFDEDIRQVLSGGAGISPFIPIITNNAVKFSATDSQLDTLDYSETWNRHKIVLGTSMQDSRLPGTLQFDFMEDNNLSIMKLNYLWKKYIENAFLGNIITATSLIANNFTSAGSFRSGQLDYMSSLYHFSVLPDGQTLNYWAKYTGVFPTVVPWSLFSSDDANVSVISSVPITFQYSVKEEMNGYILNDFNLVSSLGNVAGKPKSISSYDDKHYEGCTVSLDAIGRFPRIVAKPKAAGNYQRKNSYKIEFEMDEEDVNG